MAAPESSAHYVYLYRDERGRPLYVGYGARPGRAAAHQIASHNPGLAKALSGNRYTIEVAGRFDSEEIGRTIETTLISALKPSENIAGGPSKARFRPLGVPEKYADRLPKPPLERAEFLRVQGDFPTSVLFVTVGDRDFDDGRVGYNPASPPTDEQVLERVEKWWQLEALAKRWTAEPAKSPGLLIGVHGAPGAQLVIAALRIDQARWGDVEHFEGGQGKIRVPCLPTPGLDAFELRGRYVSRAAGLAFEGVPSGFFIVLGPDGTLAGGRRSRRARLGDPGAEDTN